VRQPALCRHGPALPGDTRQSARTSGNLRRREDAVAVRVTEGGHVVSVDGDGHCRAHGSRGGTALVCSRREGGANGSLCTQPSVWVSPTATPQPTPARCSARSLREDEQYRSSGRAIRSRAQRARTAISFRFWSMSIAVLANSDRADTTRSNCTEDKARPLPVSDAQRSQPRTHVRRRNEPLSHAATAGTGPQPAARGGHPRRRVRRCALQLCGGGGVQEPAEDRWWHPSGSCPQASITPPVSRTFCCQGATPSIKYTDALRVDMCLLRGAMQYRGKCTISIGFHAGQNQNQIYSQNTAGFI
jgi:hypothetical protein